MLKRIITMLLTAICAAASVTWLLGSFYQIGIGRLTAVVLIGYAAWTGKMYLDWRWER